jgi:xanthine dehydrogenase molybdopterin-binding subunit B
MFGGRAEKTLEYSVGWDEEGHITALDMTVICMGEYGTHVRVHAE